MLGADVGELVLAAVDQAVAGPDDVGRPVVEQLDQVAEPVPGLDVEERAVRARRGLLGDQVAQRGVAVLVHRGVQADVLAAPGHQVEDPVDVHVELGGDLLGLRVAAELALQGAAGGADLVELLDDVHGQPDDAGLLRDAAGDRLAHPPGGVGGELVALGVVELLDRADQAGVALLDQVQHRHLAAAVLAGDGDHQPQVGLDEPLDRPAGPPRRATRAPPRLAYLGAPPFRRPTRPSARRCSARRPASMVLLSSTSVIGVEQRGARDLVEVHADAVASLDLTRCGASRCHGACRPFLWGQGHTQRCALVFTTTTNACSRFPRFAGRSPVSDADPLVDMLTVRVVLLPSNDVRDSPKLPPGNISADFSGCEPVEDPGEA